MTAFRNFVNRLKHGNRLGMICLAVAACLFVAGTFSVLRGLREQRAVAATENLGDISGRRQQPEIGRYLPYSLPSSIRIPAVGITSALVTVGKTAEGTVDVPKAPDFDKAAWYRDSPAPGQYGAAVIVGHVDSYANNNGASVFYTLSRLKLGDKIFVDRADRTTAVFQVYATRQFERSKLPSEEVYQPDSANAELRLITCAGRFDRKTAEYDSNTVIFASLTD